MGRDRVRVTVRDTVRVGVALARNIPDPLLLSGGTSGQLAVQPNERERLTGVRLTRP